MSSELGRLSPELSAIADLVGWVEMTKPNITFISYLNICFPKVIFAAVIAIYSFMVCLILTISDSIFNVMRNQVMRWYMQIRIFFVF